MNEERRREIASRFLYLSASTWGGARKENTGSKGRVQKKMRVDRIGLSHPVTSPL